MLYPRSKGFTLIELLVVIAIIGILSSVVLAALSSAKDRGNLAAALTFAGHNHQALGAYSAIDVTFAEGSGATTFDGVANAAITGTINGSSWSTDTPTGTGHSFNFNGTNNNVLGNINGNVFVNDAGVEQSFTIAAWFKRTSANQWSAIFSNSVGVNDTVIMTMRNNTTEFGMMRPGVAETGVYVDLGSSHLNQWVYGVVTYNQATNNLSVYAYVDGKLLKNTGQLSWQLQKTGTYYIGRHNSTGYYFTGKISEVHVYSSVLSIAQIEEKYLASKDFYESGNI